MEEIDAIDNGIEQYEGGVRRYCTCTIFQGT